VSSSNIRHLVEADVPAVADLITRVFPQHGWSSREECASYVHETLFNNPWSDLGIPSWIAETRNEIAGIYAVFPRPMLLRGRAIRVGVGCLLGVDTDKRHSLTALELIKACCSGPQDVMVADGANDRAQQLWVGTGRRLPLLYSLHWTRPLRPAQLALSKLQERGSFPKPLSLLTRPVAALADAACARLRPNRFLRDNDSGTREEPLEPETILSHLGEVMNGSALQPVYRADSLNWIFGQVVRKRRLGKLRARAVLSDSGRVRGWYMYFARSEAASEVLELAAAPGSYDLVLRHLLADAWREGATAVRGRLDPRYARELSDRNCWFRWDGSWTLVHARDPEVMTAIDQDQAVIGRLDGEWWLRFLGW